MAEAYIITRKQSLEQFEDFLGQKPENCEEDHPIYHGKTTRPNNKIFTSTENIPTETFQIEYWNYNLGGVSVYTSTDWQLTKIINNSSSHMETTNSMDFAD